jgi:transcriptional regulator with XRE-family HTH domain
MLDIRKIVGRNVRRLRKAKELSQEELSFECELHRTYLSGVERGIRNPTVVIIQRIATALNVPAGKLLERRPAANKEN